MSFEDIARRMNKSDKPIDLVDLQRKDDRFQGVVMILAGLVWTAVSVAMNLWLLNAGWTFSAGIMLTILGVFVIGLGTKQVVKNLRKPRA